MPDILLTTLNAKYPHAAFGLRYLHANLGLLAQRAAILEFDINQRPTDILEALLAQNPRIIGLGVYIWNAAQSTLLAANLKRLRPDITLILGGPEISYETDQQEIAQYADFILTGEADLAFANLCEKLLAGQRPPQKILAAELPQFETTKGTGAFTKGTGAFISPLSLPYHLYTDHDLAHRVIYVEASRGCPFKCEFCLSSLDVPLRNVPLAPFLAAMQSLLDRGLRHFKFVDRTFNLNLNISKAILQFFLDRYQPGLFLHFEMIPDRLPEALRTPIQQFPPAALQFEVGIQTFNDEVAALISRKQDNAKVEENLRFLRNATGVHLHTDLIVGLPGEDLPSFAAGFDRLVRLNPQEIQVGMLKRLRGTPIVRHDAQWGMLYTPHPPYEILQTRLIDFAAMQRLRRFSRYWDLLSNSGNFRDTLPLLWTPPTTPSPATPVRWAPPTTPPPGTGLLLTPSPGTPGEGQGEGLPLSPSPGTPREGRGEGLRLSPFHTFLDLSDRLYENMGRNHGIALQDLAQFLFHHLTLHTGHAPPDVARSLWQDYQRTGRSDRPPSSAPSSPTTPSPAPRAPPQPPPPAKRATSPDLQVQQSRSAPIHPRSALNEHARSRVSWVAWATVPVCPCPPAVSWVA